MQKEIQSTNEHIVFLGESGFPFGLAAIQRITLIAKAFVYVGINTTVICRKGVWKKNQRIDFPKSGKFEGINYMYTTKGVHKPIGFIDRNFQKLRGMYGEFIFLKHLKRDNAINLAIVSEMKVVHIIRYLIFSTFLNFPIAINFVEMASSMQNRNGLFVKLNDFLLDNWILKLFDGAIPISDKLLRHYRVTCPSKPCFKLPILCDFEKFKVPREKQNPYFLYCGNIGYKDVIDFVVEVYKEVNKNNSAKLYLIVSGESEKEIANLEQEISKHFTDKQIKVFSNIPYDQLVGLYINATALLIPLRPTEQDASRFPHKIGEYLASENPVITTKVGEIKNYFEDGKTALVAETYTTDAFAEKMKFVLDCPERSKEIGISGKKLGLLEFDYRAHGIRLRKFLTEISTMT